MSSLEGALTAIAAFDDHGYEILDPGDFHSFLFLIYCCRATYTSGQDTVVPAGLGLRFGFCFGFGMLDRRSISSRFGGIR